MMFGYKLITEKEYEFYEVFRKHIDVISLEFGIDIEEIENSLKGKIKHDLNKPFFPLRIIIEKSGYKQDYEKVK